MFISTYKLIHAFYSIPISNLQALKFYDNFETEF